MAKNFDQPVVPVPPAQQNIPKPNVDVAIAPFEPNWDDADSDFDLKKIISHLEDGKLAQLQPPTSNTICSTAKSPDVQCMQNWKYYHKYPEEVT